MEDAFSTSVITANEPVIFLEGKTDEEYFKKAAEIFANGESFEFRWIGYLDSVGKERNTGKGALNSAYEFLVSKKERNRCVCLFDCDTNRQTQYEGNVLSICMPRYKGTKGMNKGTENVLLLDDVDIDSCYHTKVKTGDYGTRTEIKELNKVELCKMVCHLPEEKLQQVFANFRSIIDGLDAYVTEGKVPRWQADSRL